MKRHYRDLEAPCGVCKRVIRVFIPAGGDGTAVRPHRHKNKESGSWCEGRFLLIDYKESQTTGVTRR